MSTRRLIGAGSVVGFGVAALMAGSPAAADTDETAPSTVDSTTVAKEVSEFEQQSAEDYWTEERMEAAEPVELEAQEDIDSAELEQFFEQQDAATPRVEQPQLSDGPHDPSETPTVGKVFFSIGGDDFVCSGNLVASANQSTVATAGHCLHEGGGGAFADNFVFAPGYDNGESEAGLWAAEELAAPSGWTQGGEFPDDVGFVKVAEENGQTIEQVVGTASEIGFNLERNLNYTAYGYPAAPPFNGEELISCTGTAIDDPMGSTTHGIDCDMTGGSSGGPWFVDGNGPQNSVNSYGHALIPDVMFGPYFGSEAEEVYDYIAGQ